MISASLVKELRDKSGAGMMDCKKALTETDGNIEAAIDWLREKGIAKAVKKESRIASEGLANIFIKDNRAVIIEVNSETDFVSKNEEFKEMINNIGETILNSDCTDDSKVLELAYEDGALNDLIVSKIAKIGEKLSFRRCAIIVKNDDEKFGGYLHMGGKIAALVAIKGDNESVAKDIAMQAAAMRPQYCFIDDVPADVIEKEKNVIKEQAVNEGKTAEIAEKLVAGRINKFYKEICLNEQDFIKDSKLSINKYLSDNNCSLLSMVRYEVGEGLEKRNDDFASEVMEQIK